MFYRVISALANRRFLWKAGRFLYMFSRKDLPNNMDTNGEVRVQRAIINRLSKSGDAHADVVVFDVGANVGDWAERFILNHKTARDSSLRLYMFEPVPETFSTLKMRIGRVASDCVCVFNQLALSSDSGAGYMYVHGKAGINSVYQDVQPTTSTKVSMQKETLVGFCKKNGISGISFVKCDTEGHDFDVLLGAMPFLKEGKIVAFQFEYNWRWISSRHYLKDVFDVLADLPYKIGKITPEGVEIYPSWHFELERFFEANFILIRNDCLDIFDSSVISFAQDNTPLVASLESSSLGSNMKG